MTKALIELQDLQRQNFRKAKSDQTHRLWRLFVRVAKNPTSLNQTWGCPYGSHDSSTH